MDDWRIGTGALCLGMIIGWLIFKFVNGQREMSFKVLSGLVTFAVGTAAMASFRVTSKDALPPDFYFYFIGVFVAVFGLGILKFGEQQPR